MLRIILSGSIGLLLGFLVVSLVGPPGAAMWALPVGMALGIISLTLLIVATVGGSIVGPSPQLIAEARAAGRTGVARIDAVSQTGTQINDQPVCRLDLSVRPAQGASYRTSMRRLVRVIEVPRFQPGTRLPIVVALPDHPDVAILDEQLSPRDLAVDIPPAGQLSERPPTVRGTLPDPGRRRPLLGLGRRGRPLRVLLYLLTVTLAAGAVILPHRESVQVAAESLRSGSLHPDIREPEPLERAIAALDEAKGHDAYVSVIVFEDRVIAEAPVEPGSQRTDDWVYQRGAVENRGPTLIQPDDAREQFTGSEIAWEAIGPALASGLEQSGLGEGADLDEVTFSVRRTPITDVHAADFGDPHGPVQITFSIGDDYAEAWFTMEADGSGLEMRED